MAEYHSTVKAVSRRDGRSAVAAAAYRAAMRMTDERTGRVFDYRAKSGVVASKILTPTGVTTPSWTHDRKQLWNKAEAAENRKDAKVAREWELALPAELDAAARAKLALEYGQWLADRYGVIVDVAIHQPSQHGDERNHHAHLLASTRQIGPEGFGEKTRQLDQKQTSAAEIEACRERWAEIGASALAAAGFDVEAARYRQGHLTLEQQRQAARDRGDLEFAEDLATRKPQSHVGLKSTQMERDGLETDRGDKRLDAQKTENSIEADEKERKQLYKTLLLQKLYKHKIAEQLSQQLSYVNARDAGILIHLKNGQRLFDEGNQVSMMRGRGRANDTTIDAMLQIAMAKDWKNIRISGDDKFKQSAARRAIEHGFNVTNPELQGFVKTIGKDKSHGRQPRQLSRSFAEASLRAKNEYESPDRDRDVMLNLSRMPLEDSARNVGWRGPRRLLPLAPRPGLGRGGARNGQMVSGKHKPVSAASRGLGCVPSLQQQLVKSQRAFVSWGDYYALQEIERQQLSVIAQSNAALAALAKSPPDAERQVQQNRSQYQPDWPLAVEAETAAKLQFDKLQRHYEQLPLSSRVISGKAAQMRHDLAEARQGFESCAKRREELDNQWATGGLKKRSTDRVAEKMRAEAREKRKEHEERRDDARRILAKAQAALALCKAAAQIGALAGQRTDRTPVYVSLSASAGDDLPAAERAAAQVQAALTRKMAEAKAKTEKERSMVEDANDDPEVARRKARMRPPGRRR